MMDALVKQGMVEHPSSVIPSSYFSIVWVIVLFLALVGLAALGVGLSPHGWVEQPSSLPRTAIADVDQGGINMRVASTVPTHTWTQDTRVDWESGTLASLDSDTLPGYLQLARRRFGEPIAIPHTGPVVSWKVAPSIAVDEGGNAYVVWEDERGNLDIYFAYRTASGVWETDMRVNDDIGMAVQSDPSVAVDENGTAYAVWRDLRDDDNGDIYFAYRLAGGTWSANVKVNDETGAAAWGIDSANQQDIAPTPPPAPPAVQGRQSDPAIAVDPSGNGYAVWTDSRHGDHDIYFAYRPVGGAWGTNVRVNDDTGYTHQYDPAIAVDRDGNAYAVWRDQRAGYDGDIYFSYRPAGGEWGSNVKVDRGPGLAQHHPSITVDDSGNAYVVWREWGQDNSKIHFAYRPTNGEWSTDYHLDEDAESAHINPVIAVDRDGNACAAWITWEYDGRVLHFARRPAGGEWGERISVPDTVAPETPGVAIGEDGKAYVVWVDHRDGDVGIYFAHSLQEYLSIGTYTSPVFDTRMVTAAWESLTHVSNVPPGTALTFETRSQASSSQSRWSDWERLSPNSQTWGISSPRGRYIQYRVAFSTAISNVTPVLDRVQVVYRWAGAPSAPHFGTACGVTNQITPTLRGSAAVGSIVHIYVDGTQITTQTVGPGTLSLGAFRVALHLGVGHHTITATAENENGIGPASSPLSLTVEPALAYDPINVRAGEWTGDGWLLTAPRAADGCANPAAGWRVWPRPDQVFRVQIPVSYTTSAAVSVTLGTQTIPLLEEERRGIFVGFFQPPIRSGDFIIHVRADGVTATIPGGPVLIDPDGFVYEVTGSFSDTIAGVTVTCYYSDTYRGHWVPWDAWNYQQINPQITSDDGYYSFYTPRGIYRVVAEKTAYPTYTSPDLIVVNAPVRHNIPLGYHHVYLPLILK